MRGRWITARRLPALPAIARARGRGEAFERSFEREARDLRSRWWAPPAAAPLPAPAGAPVWRLLAA